jgi:hypothetical protein
MSKKRSGVTFLAREEQGSHSENRMVMVLLNKESKGAPFLARKGKKSCFEQEKSRVPL